MKEEVKCPKCGYAFPVDDFANNVTCPFCKCEFEKRDENTSDIDIRKIGEV